MYNILSSVEHKNKNLLAIVFKNLEVNEDRLSSTTKVT